MNILDLPDIALNPLDGTTYIVQGGLDKSISTDNLLNVAHNQSVRFNSQALTTGLNTINFSDRSGQVDFADTDYLVIPYAFDVDGIPTPVTLPPAGKAVSGFTVNNESGVDLTFNYIAIKL
jgi:hypothetical protein